MRPHRRGDVRPGSGHLAEGVAHVLPHHDAAGLVAGGLLLLQFARPPEPAPAPELYSDFRGGAAPLPPLALVGSDAAAVTRPEEGGFRIILPPRRKQTDAVGLTLSGPVRGDFEITVRYQILHADRPVDGHGVGFELYAQTDTPTRDGAEDGKA